MGPSTSAIKRVRPVVVDLYLCTGIVSLHLREQINSNPSIILLAGVLSTGAMNQYFDFTLWSFLLLKSLYTFQMLALYNVMKKLKDEKFDYSIHLFFHLLFKIHVSKYHAYTNGLILILNTSKMFITLRILEPCFRTQIKPTRQPGQN